MVMIHFHNRYIQRGISVLFCFILINAIPVIARTSSDIHGKGHTSDDPVVNLALTATVTTSFVSSWETLGAVNDGDEPVSSSEDDGITYGNWNGESYYNTWNWVQYEWEKVNKFISTSVYWWNDGGGIKQPYAAYVDYWNGTEWALLDSIGTELDKYNSIEFDTITTNKIRIYMISETSTGIQQWKVMGIEGELCNPTPLVGRIKINSGEWVDTDRATANLGDVLYLGVTPADSGIYTWDGPSGYTATGSTITLDDVQVEQGGTYVVTLLNSCWVQSNTHFFVTVNDLTNVGATYIWPSYTPTLAYNFREEYPALEMPTRDLPDCDGVVGGQASGWWTFLWGADANRLVSRNAITPLLERMNKDFAYFRDTMGWPPDKRARNGYRSAIYLYGSGLCTDNASNKEKGGWQSSINYNGESWPMVLLSYYPVYSFDPACDYSDAEYQQGACVHEGIHSILADMPGVKESAWFHEGGNTWLQQEMTARQSGDFSSMGYLNGCTFIAPFMPIECYSGWLQDDTFGGPSAEGVNKYNDSGKQLCTWRNYLGGTQYGNAFPTFLGMTLGHESVAWIWRYCPKRVLEGMADTLGEYQIRRLIMEYRAKQALLDMGEWTGAVKSLINNYFGTTIKSEWNPTWLNPEIWKASPYAITSNDGNGLLTPEYRTTPGWSGANQIPLHVEGDRVTVNFQPIGTNMSCQLCYRDVNGNAVYSQPVYGGDCSLNLETAPANGVVFAVIVNSDYIYKGESTRTAHFDYRLQLGEGVERIANPALPWYDWTKTIDDPNTGIEPDADAGFDVKIFPNPVVEGELIKLEPGISNNYTYSVRINDIQGRLIYQSSSNRGSIEISTDRILSKGFYLITVLYRNSEKVYKLIVQ